jgi:prepilin-type N-terminal cleavage/methylation domain-containing protein
MNFSNNKGFTILETILVIALFSIILSISVPIYSLFQSKNDLNITKSIITNNLRRAQILSRNMASDTTWGVIINTSTVTIFQGTDYSSRIGLYDENYSFPEKISTSGTLEYVFNKFTGEPQTTGTIELILDNESQFITINEKGKFE